MTFVLDDNCSEPAPSVISLDGPTSPTGSDQESESDEVELSTSLICYHATSLADVTLECLRATWCSAVYGFFKTKVDIVYKGKCKAHVFYCAAKRCKGKGTVRRFQDSTDKAGTSNLKTHAIKCFGQDTVDAAFKQKTPSAPSDGSIFTAFSRQGQQPISISHCTHTSDEARAHMALWCSESHRAMRVVRDHQFITLMKAGRPGTTLPSPSTVSRDIKAAFERCHERIDGILRNHDGHVHFATDAWTVHLHHQGNILVFLLDVMEVPESHTGKTLATVFHQMLIKHGLENKILAFNADNALPNDTQTDHLDSLPNNFDSTNRVCCFNHRLQLSARALLVPFSKDDDDNGSTAAADPEPGSDLKELEDLNKDDKKDNSDDNGSDNGDDNSDGNGNGDGDDGGNNDSDDDNDNPFAGLDKEEQQELLANTDTVQTTLNKLPIRLISSGLQIAYDPF
ncbi:hypothetical protein DXG01_004289 [Tephrocybe rancida]|nr:hypothetical protein DXG01_004289 [Tephrocybe rancida]